MRVSRLLLVTLRDDPAEAEIVSHKLLLRGGYIRRISSGIYAYLPLLWRVLQKVESIVREEMNATGALETLLPQLQPADCGSAAAAGTATPLAKESCFTSTTARVASWAWDQRTKK